MTTIGLFGKLPAFGDFVSVKGGSRAHRAFERWLEGSNDAMAGRRQLLSPDPLGFIVRGEDSASLLVGIIVGSQDKVGRRFPLGLFYEVEHRGLFVPGLPLAMTPELHRLAVIARRARTRGHVEIEQLVRAVPRPAGEQLAVRSQAELHRLRIVRASLLIRRVYGEGHAPHYGHAVMLRACARSVGAAGRLPLVLEGRVRTDVELMYTLASLQAVSRGQQPGVVLWAVRNQRVLMALGRPDQGLLGLMLEGEPPPRVWPLWTEQLDVAGRTRAELGEAPRALLDDPGPRSAKDFLDAMADACSSHSTRMGTMNERRVPWRTKAP